MPINLPSPLKTALPWCLLMAAAYLLYQPAFAGIWLMDDLPVLVNNPDIRSFANFLEDYYPGRPLRELTYLADYQMFGLEPAGYYLQQIFWHGLNAGLLLLLATRLGAPAAVAWLAALLFLVHPVQVEVVANISHRKDSLALAFSLLAMLAWLKGRAAGRASGRWWLAGALALWGIALTAKQNPVVLPAVLAVWEFRHLPERWKRPALLGTAVLALLALTGRLLWLINDPAFHGQIGPALRKLGHFPLGNVSEYYLTTFKAWALMGTKLLYPVHLSMEYTFSAPTGWTDPWVASGLLGGLGLAGAFFLTIRRAPMVGLGLAWLLVFWLPTSNLLGHLAYFAADRYWYAPLAGLSLALAALLWHLVRRNRAALILPAILLLGPLCWLTWQQQAIWTDEQLFYDQMRRVNPEALEGFIGQGRIALGKGDLATADALFRQAYQRSPQEGRVLNNLGYIAYRRGEHSTALAYFRDALQHAPRLVEVHNNLGSLYSDLGQPEQAIAALEQALKINSHYEKTYTNLGLVYERLGDLEKAEAMHRAALRERPDYAVGHFNLGYTLYLNGRHQDALAAYLTVVRLEPQNADALYNAAYLARELNQTSRFNELVTRLQRIDPQRADSLVKP